MWPPKHKDPGANNCYGSMVRSEGMWPPSSQVDISLNLFPDSRGDNRPVTTRSSMSCYASPVPSRPNNQVEKGTKSDASTGCRLFGINLTSKCNSTSTASPPDREPGCSIVVPSIDKGSTPAAASEGDRAQNQEASKLSMEQKIASDSPQKGQSKQGSTLSSRSRTKVKFSLAPFVWFELCF